MTSATNWAGSYVYRSARIHTPADRDELRRVVGAAPKVKALGTRHSFNGVGDTTGDHVSLARLDRVLAIDRERCLVTVEGGARYGDVSRRLAAEGLAFANLASLPHISIAGACATATHGSGDHAKSLASAVVALELVGPDGATTRLSRDDGDRFRGAVVSLGALGVVSSLTLEVEPAFDVRQDVYEDLPFARIEDRFDAITSSGTSVSLFTDWASDRFSAVWIKRRVEPGEVFAPEPSLFEATLAREHRHPVPGAPTARCTPQLGIVGPSHERLPHFRLEFTPSWGEEIQSEYLVPRPHACAAFAALAALGDALAPSLHVSEVRTIAADDLWMSPFYEQPCVGIHFTWRKDAGALATLLPRLEAALAPLGARPHWGKTFATAPPALAASFPRLPSFRELARELDPGGKFRNEFLDRFVFSA